MKFLALACVLAIAFACDHREVPVSSAEGLTAALADARPGDNIKLAPSASFLGPFFIKASGAVDCRIEIRGVHDILHPSVITGGGFSRDMAGLTIEGDYVSVIDIMFKDTMRGIVIDGAQYTKINSVPLSNIGEEAVVIANNAAHTEFAGNWISYTGRSDPNRGYGILIGIDSKDACTDTVIVSTQFMYGITKEHIFIGASSHRTFMKSNEHFAEGMTKSATWVSILSNGNQFISVQSVSWPGSITTLLDGVQISGNSNFVQSSRWELYTSGYGVRVTSGTGNRVCATNAVTLATAVSNIPLDSTC